MSKPDYIIALDIGSSFIRTVISQIIPDGKTRIIGVGVAPSQGMRRGMVVDLEEVSQSIRVSIEEAQRHSGVTVESVFVTIGGSHIQCLNAKGVIAVGRADGEVAPEDVLRVIDASQAVSLPLNQEIIHVIPQRFKLDEQEGINDPVGMVGVRLEMQGLIITGSVVHIKNISKCIEALGIGIEDFVVAPIAASKAVLNKRQKELGVVLIDIGGGTTSITVYEERELVHVAVLPVGATHITNDIAIGLRTSIEVAERVKIEYGSALPGEISKKELINLGELDSQEEGSVSRRHVAEIIEARMEEIFIYVEKDLKKINRSGLLPAGCILTGGGAKLQGSIDLAKNILQLPAQTGFPFELSGLVDKVDSPEFSVVIGTILWAVERGEDSHSSGKNSRFQSIKGGLISGLPSMKSATSGMKKWISKLLP